MELWGRPYFKTVFFWLPSCMQQISPKAHDILRREGSGSKSRHAATRHVTCHDARGDLGHQRINCNCITTWEIYIYIL